MICNLNTEGSLKRLICTLALFALATGCASNLMIEMQVDSYLPQEDYEGALAEIEQYERNFGERNRLLFLLNRGALNFYSCKYQESASDFLQAARVSEELFTRRISVEAAGAVSPNLKPYDGEDYEKVMIHIFAAFSFIKMGRLEEAGVEARRINEKLELLSQKYEAENKYSNDAFARYLSGMIYEAIGDINDAYISYKLALAAYRNYKKMFPSSVPAQLKDDILRLASELGFREQYEEFSRRFGLEWDGRDSGGEGQAVVIAFAGLAPFKRELETRFTHVDDEGKTHTFQILVPELVERGADNTMVLAGYSGSEGTVTAKAEVVHDIESIAKKNMSDRMPGIMIKGWLRALAKFKATEEAKKKMETGSRLGNFLIGSITDALAEEVTRADVRCWRTLPAEIYLKRFRLKPGTYDFNVEIGSAACSLERTVKKDVEIRSNRISFIFAESFQ